jgi:drug/metabolite transporter (DMT)-like permease
VLGGFLALCSAASFAFNNASVRRAVLTGSIAQGMAITVPIGVPLFFIAALVTGNLAAVLGFSPTALAALSAAGILHFVWGRYCNYRATRAIGTNLVAPIQQFNLLVTLVLAIWLLGEYLTPLKILGIALILLGPTFTVPKKKSASDARPVSEEKITPIDAEKPRAFQPKSAED